jgi:hypothetical protein
MAVFPSHGFARVVIATNVTVPVISGSIVENATISATRGIWNGFVDDYAYQWKADNVDISGANSADYQLTAAEVTKAITVAVTATNGAGASSAAISAATAAVSSASVPGDISDLNLTPASSSALDLAYTPATNAITHEAQYRTPAGSGAYTGPVALSSNQITGLLANTGYGVQVRGVNAAGNGNWSTEDTATTDASGAIGGITDLAVSAVDTDTLSLTFGAASGAVSYEYKWAPRIKQTSGGSAANISTGLWTAAAALSGGSGSNIDVPYPANQYEVQVRGADGATKGDWSNVALGSTNSPAASTSKATPVYFDYSGVDEIDGLIVGARWNTAAPISCSFPSSGTYYKGPGGGDYLGGENTNNFAECTETQKNSIRFCLAWVSFHTGLRFYEMTETDTDHATLRWARFGSAASGAHSTNPSFGATLIGDTWYGNGFCDSPAIGNKSWLVVWHETLHALGFHHPHITTTGKNAAGTTVLWPALPNSPGHSYNDLDAVEWTLISYRDYRGAPATGYFGNPTNYMLGTLDLQALKYMYGENTTVTGDTEHTFNSTTGAYAINGVTLFTPYTNTLAVTVASKGGADTIDITNYVGQDVSLTAGANSTISAGQKLSNRQGNIYIGLNGTIEAKQTA